MLVILVMAFYSTSDLLLLTTTSFASYSLFYGLFFFTD